MERVEATLENTTTVLQESGENTYSANMTAPLTRNSESTSVYSVAVTATGDSGETTTEEKELIVTGLGIFPLEFIAAKPSGEEIDFCREGIDIDLDIGDTDDFELRLSAFDWDKEKYNYNYRLFIPGTEYGGIIDDLEVLTSASEIVFRGPTWRGMLKNKIILPPEDASHLIVSGELNTVVRELISDRFGSLFAVPEIDTGITIENWQVDRYASLYDSIMKILDSVGHRLQIAYYQPEGLEYGYVTLWAVPVADYSNQIEYSQDGKVHFSVRDYRGGINHLICIGKGQNEERIELHLYVQEDGTIGNTQYYFGANCREAVYEYSSAEEDALREGGVKRLKELMNYKQIDVTVDDMELELGDIIGGYEQITGTQVQKPIVGKILKVQNGKTTIEYEVKGEN